MKTTFLMFLLSACIVRAGEYYVAPNGDDAADGSKDHPFATLERGRDAVRGAKAGGSAVIWLEPGVYRRTGSFELDARDSGLVVRCLNGGTARLHAGRMLRTADFHPVTDAAILSRLDSSARGKVVQLDLAASKIEHARSFPDTFCDGGGIFDLYFGDKLMPISRWPNDGSTTMEKVLDRGDTTSKAPGAKGGVFVAREERVARWRVESGVWLEGYWRVPWEPRTIRVKSIEPATRTVTFAAPIQNGIGSKYAKKGQLGDGKEAWCALNLLEEIDRPGQWCVDFATKTLFFWPPDGWPHVSVYVSDFDKPMVVVRDAAHVTLRSLQFEGGLGNGVELTGGNDNLIAGCTFRNLGGKGVCIDGGSNNGVRSCDFDTLGQGGVYLAGGDRATLKPCGNFAENNDIHNLGLRQKTYAAAVHVGAYGGGGEAVGCRVTHNYIHDLPHAGVLYGGNDNLFEYNEVARVALTSGDVGAFYTWNDWTSWGNILRHNFVHDSPRANAFYMDDGDSGDMVCGNVAYRISYGSLIGGGHFNTVRNNLFIDAERGLQFDARGIARGYAKNPKMLKRLESAHLSAPPWSERYPSLAKLMSGPRDVPTGNVVENNVFIRCKKTLLLSGTSDLRLSTVRDNLDLGDTDPGFVNAARLNFELKPESSVYKKLPAFKPIAFGKIGLYRDEFRKRLPERSSAGPARNNNSVFDSNTDVQRSNTKAGAPIPEMN